MNVGRSVSIAMIALSMVSALSLWFSASALVPALRSRGDLDPVIASLFSSGVQFGFVVGTVVGAVFVLADRLN